MEGKRSGQQLEADRWPTEQAIHEGTAPVSPMSPPSDKERAPIENAQRRADQDCAASRATGHGDHKGKEGIRAEAPGASSADQRERGAIPDPAEPSLQSAVDQRIASGAVEHRERRTQLHGVDIAEYTDRAMIWRQIVQHP
jgi:hypothetical protein